MSVRHHELETGDLKLETFPGRDSVPIPDLLPYHSYDPEGRVFVMSDGSLGLAWRMTPLECETLSEEQLGMIALRLESLLRLLPERSAAQFLLQGRRDVKNALARWTSVPTSGLYRDLVLSRARATEGFEMAHDGATLVARSFELTATLRVFPTWAAPTFVEGLRFVLRGANTVEDRFRAAYASAKRALLDGAASMENLVAQLGISMERLDTRGLLGLLHRVLNPTRARFAPPPVEREDRLLREQIAFSPGLFDLEGIVRLDGQEHRILSAAEVPRETWAGMLQRPAAGSAVSVVDLVPEATLVFNLEVPEPESIRKFLQAKKRLAFCQLSSGDEKIDVSAMKQEVDAAIGEIFTDGARVLSTRFHVIVRGGREASHAVVNALSRIGLEMVEEDVLAPTLFLQSLPLAYDPANDRALRRGRKMMGLNVAHLLPVYGSVRGTARPDLLFLNRRGEPITFSFFDADVAPHGIVAGVSGSGKSVLANNLILSTARKGARIFVLDRGNSYRKLCEILGGTYLDFDPAAPKSLNPCGRDLTEERILFLTDILAEMCTQGRRELEPKERSLLARAIVRAFEGAERERTISDIRRALNEDPEPTSHDLAVCLEMFSGAGPYAGFFDRPNELSLDRPLTVFELGDIAKRRDIGSVLLMALIHNITEFAASRLDLEKYLIVDEAWTLLKSDTTAHFLEDVLRTYRKLNAAAVMVTQQVSDFDSRTGEAIRANAPNRFFLRQTAETVLAMEKLLDLSLEEKTLLSGVTTVKGRFSEALLLAPGTRGVVRLVPDPLTYWITTSDPKDNEFLYEEVARYRKQGDPDPLRRALQSCAVKRPQGVGA